MVPSQSFEKKKKKMVHDQHLKIICIKLTVIVKLTENKCSTVKLI